VNNSWPNIDLRALVENLRESISSLGGFSPEQVRVAASMGEDRLQAEILKTLEAGAKTGHEIVQAIAEASKVGFKPKAANVYPLLEKLIDTGLVSASMKKDRRVFSLTVAGKEAAAQAELPIEDAVSENRLPWSAPTWVDLNGELAKASKHLANVAFEVAQTGTKAQQAEAAKVIDESRRKLHAILAAE
jgi:DNA-binding PadR family transcriptional regulator